MDELDQHYGINTFGIASVEFFWGLGLPVVLESTFLQLFLKEMGASSVVVGLIPSFFFISQAFLGLFAAYGAAKLKHKRTAVIAIHCIPAFFISLFGVYLLAFGFGNHAVGIFLILYALFSMGIGLILPVWQNYLVLIFTPHRTLSALSIMMMCQSAARLIGSFLIAKVVAALSFSPLAGALVFLSCGLLFFGSSFLFLVTKEPPADPEWAPPVEGRFPVFLKQSVSEVLRNRNFLFFLGSELEFFAVVTVLSFYANFATENFGVTATLAAGGFVGFNYAGQFFVNWVFGIRGALTLKQKAYLSRICSLLGVLAMALFPSTPVFLGASALLGLSRAVRSLIYAPVVKKISGLNDATHYFAAAPLLTVPLSGGLSLVSGRFLDVFSSWGDWAYRSLFLFLGLFILASVFFLKKSRF